MDCNQGTVLPEECGHTKEVETELLKDFTMEHNESPNCEPCQNISFKRTHDDDDDTDVTGMEPEKKLCRFYYLDHCTKAGSCSFMHSEFPCKFYYFGYECKDGKNCKLLHGSALDPDMRHALWCHVMSAPSNLLQRFPCFPQVILKKDFDDRHNELIQMEQEGLLDDNIQCIKAGNVNPVSTPWLSEDNNTVSQAQVTIDAFEKLGELVKILTPKQIASLTSFGVETMDQLFQLGASTLLDLGFDFDTLIKIGNFKEMQRKKSIYTAESDQESQVQHEITTFDVFGFDVLDVSLTARVDQHVLTDEELLSILNEDLNPSSVATIEPSSIQVSLSSDDFNPKALATKNHDSAGVKTNQNDDCSFIAAESMQDNGCVLKAFRSDTGSECRELMLYPAVKEIENDQKSLDSIQRTVDQLKKIDSLLSEEKRLDISWGSVESDVSTDNGPRHDSSVTDSVNQSFGSDSDSFRMPFKSIINRYTPATEIDASNGKFRIAQYKLIPVDVPKPNFDRIRRTFVTAPTYSLDPRIQIMFNVGPTEIRHVDPSKAGNRDPRLKKAAESQLDDVSDHSA